MKFEELARRQALLAWRDVCVQGIWIAFHLATKGAREQLASDLGEAGMRDTYWDPGAFIRPRIDKAMRSSLAGPLSGLMHQAAAELRTIDPELAELAAGLPVAAAAVIGCAVLALPSPATGTGEAEAIWNFENSNSWAEQARQFGIAGIAAALTAPALLTGVIGYGVATLAKPLFSFRLTSAIEARLNESWTGMAADPQSAMAGLLIAIDMIALEAQRQEI